jgi:fumarylacetoacetase
MDMIDETHDPTLRSWVASANVHPEFPIQNLPLGAFTPPGAPAPRGGVAIGDMVFDLAAAHAAGVFSGAAAEAAAAAEGPALNALFALGNGPRQALRRRLSELLERHSDTADSLADMLHPATQCTLHLPAQIGDYTDFYAGIHHALNVGRLFRPDKPLLPNYKHMPIGYHGRASSIIPSGTPVRRPNGQIKRAEKPDPEFGPCERLDYELELGIWIGPGNALGKSVPAGEAIAHIAGFCLLNDWSARDIQAWEYQPLGPFLAKSFATTLSPWVITPEALAPFRIPQPARDSGDPAPLPYLLDKADQGHGAFDIELEVLLLTQEMRRRGIAPHRLTLSNTKHLYWTVAQMLAHHTGNGCNLRPGDLFGSGTVSTPGEDGCGSLLEATKGGTAPLLLPSGEARRFLEDGDEVILRGRARRDGFASIGFGECRAHIEAAPCR